MTDPTKVSLPANIAEIVRKSAPVEGKLSILRGENDLSLDYKASVLLILFSDPSEEVRGLAKKKFLSLKQDELVKIIQSPRTPSVFIDAAARYFGSLSTVSEAISERRRLPDISEEIVRFDENNGSSEENGSPPDEHFIRATDEDENESEEVSEEFKSKYQLAQQLSVSEKIKFALTGDKEWRSIFIKDSNKQVSGAVIKNPRISDSEVLAICKSSIQNDEIIRTISMNKEWAKNYQIKKALVENHRTPLANALRFLATLSDKDLASIAKSKNVATVISTQAKRLVVQKKRD